jgi:hypothetical protein
MAAGVKRRARVAAIACGSAFWSTSRYFVETIIQLKMAIHPTIIFSP